MFITHGCPFGLCCSTPLHTNGIIISKVGFQFRNEQALKIYNMLALHINLISIKLVPRFYLFILIMLLSTRRFLFILRIILVLLSSFESYFFFVQKSTKAPIHTPPSFHHLDHVQKYFTMKCFLQQHHVPMYYMHTQAVEF